MTTSPSPAPRATWWTTLLHTGDEPGPTIARLGLGLVILAHGLQKTLGWFGGYGLAGTLGFFTGNLGIPAPLAFLAIATESVGALALIAGACTRLAALAIAVEMGVAVLLIHLQYGFFMNWTGAQAGEGFEYHLLAVALALVSIVQGGGRGSVDRILSR